MAGGGIGGSRGRRGANVKLTPWGEILEQARIERGWSQEATVHAADIKSPSVWTTTIKGGRYNSRGEWQEVLPLAETLANLALALGLDAREVLVAAGYKYLPDEPVVYNLKPVPTDQLQAELRQRRAAKGSSGRSTTRRGKKPPS